MTVKAGSKKLSYNHKINRDRFNKLCEKLFQGTMGVVDQAIENARKEISDIQIDDIVSNS